MNSGNVSSKSNVPLLISVEGIEGAGKGTQIRRMTEFLESRGLKGEVLREPGTTELGNKLRSQLLKSNLEICPISESLLFLAARAQLIHERISCSSLDYIILDRFHDSTYAYQGYGLGVDTEWLLQTSRAQGLAIDLSITFLIDISVETSIARIKARGEGSDQIENRSSDYFENVRDGYLKLAKDFPERIKLINGEDDEESVFQQIVRLLEPLIKSQ